MSYTQTLLHLHKFGDKLPISGVIHLYITDDNNIDIMIKTCRNVAAVLANCMVIVTGTIPSSLIHTLFKKYNNLQYIVPPESIVSNNVIVTDLRIINFINNKKYKMDIYIKLSDIGLDFHKDVFSIASSPFQAYLNLSTFLEFQGVLCPNISMIPSYVLLDKKKLFTSLCNKLNAINKILFPKKDIPYPSNGLFIIGWSTLNTLCQLHNLFFLEESAKSIPNLEDKLFWGILTYGIEYKKIFKVDKKIDTVAIHFPQFHQIPENDKFWGTGFVEWTLLKKAKNIEVLSKYGHEIKHPHSDIGYYDLSLIGDRKKQRELANKYNIDIFMFYHYWFECGKVMHKVVEHSAALEEPNMPFFICWANEPWNRRWSGQETEVLISQNYGGINDWTKHFEYLTTLFKSPNYYRLNGKPIIAIYRPEHMGNKVFIEMINHWRILAEPYGGLFIIAANGPFDLPEWCVSALDAVYNFEPHKILRATANTTSTLTEINTTEAVRKETLSVRRSLGSIETKAKSLLEGSIVSSADVSLLLGQAPRENKNFLGIFTHLDNSPRHLNNPSRLFLSTPTNRETFKRLLIIQMMKAMLTLGPAGPNKDLIFLSSWNEWNEGAVLEPSLENGYMFLESHKECKDFITDTFNIQNINFNKRNDDDFLNGTKLIIFDTYSGLCNQFYDICMGIDFCLKNNLRFTFRYATHRNDDLCSWFNVYFNQLFDTKFLQEYDLYVDFDRIKHKLNRNNTYNYDSKLLCLCFLNLNDNLYKQIMSINKDFIVLKQFYAVYNLPDIDNSIYNNIRPAPALFERFNNIKLELLDGKPYNFIHYRYEKDWVNFNRIHNLPTLSSAIANIKFKQNLKIYIATTDIKELLSTNQLDPNKELIYKNEESLSDLNFEEKGFIDFMFGLESNEVWGMMGSSFSFLLNRLKNTDNYYYRCT